MVTETIKELSAAKARVEQLEKSIASELQKELSQLPSAYGFGDVSSFIRALKEASVKRRGRPATKPAGAKRRKRSKITDTTRARVKELVGAGKTGTQIAKTLKISLPSVQNIKKALGLVKGHKKPTPKKKVLKAPMKKLSTPKRKKKPVVKRAAPEVKAPPAPAPVPVV
jgi:hypothetical protein